MFGCAAFGEVYFGDLCFEGGAPAPPLRVGGFSHAGAWREKPREEEVDEFALLLALGYVE